jgi:isovaleryl-CoA dehydrogenase
MDFTFSDEQQHFTAAIRDFCQRECGTQEQRERLTNGYSEQHSAEIYKKMADLGWLGITIDESVGGSGGGMVDACIFLEETMRGLIPIAGYGVSLIVAGAYERFGTEEQK